MVTFMPGAAEQRTRRAGVVRYITPIVRSNVSAGEPAQAAGRPDPGSATRLRRPRRGCYHKPPGRGVMAERGVAAMTVPAAHTGRLHGLRERIRAAWDVIDDADIDQSGGSLEKLVDTIARKSGQPRADVRRQLRRLFAA